MCVSIPHVVANSYEYAVPYTDENKDASESSNGRSFSPGGIVVEDGVMCTRNNCISPSSDLSLLELDIASPESSFSIEVGKPSVLSSSSFSNSGPGSGRSENASDDVPYELSALSQTRHTPPPRFTQFNFRKRRSRGTPKFSPTSNVLSAKGVVKKSQENENPPKKVAKLVGTDDLENTMHNHTALKVATVEAQTDAQFIEDARTVNLTPQNIIIRAFARSSSEPCLATAKKSVSFVTKDNYISDAEEMTEMVKISEGARKRMSRAKRRFPSRGIIDASKITDSLKLLRVRMGLDPDGTHSEGVGAIAELNNQVEVKTKAKTLATIKNKFIRKIASSPVRQHKTKDEEIERPVTALSNVNIGDTGIQVTEDNCSTTALRGSPLSTRSSSVLEVDEAGCSNKVAPLPPVPAESTSMSSVVSDTKVSQNSPPFHKLPFFTFSLGRKKSHKNKVQETKSHDEATNDVEKNLSVSEIKSVHLPEKSYFQTLDNMGKMSPAIKNIGNKYKLFSRSHATVPPDVCIKDFVEKSNAMSSPRKDSDLFLTPFQSFVEKDVGKSNKGTDSQSPTVASLHAVQSHVDVSVEAAEISKGDIKEEPAMALSKDTEEGEAVQTGGSYAPNEGDQNKPLIKRTKKSTNIAIDKDAVIQVRNPNAKKPSKQKKYLKKTNSITQRLRRIWSSRNKVSKSEQGLETEAALAQEESSQDRRDKLATISDTVTAQAMQTGQPLAEAEMLTSKSASALVYPVSAESSTSDEGGQVRTLDIDSPKNINQNCDNLPIDAIFRLQNFVHSFTQSETDVSYEVFSPEPTNNTVPEIKRKEMSDKTVQLSGSSSIGITEPCLQSEDANLDYPVRMGSDQNRTDGGAVEVEDMDTELTDKHSKPPRRICPTRVPVHDELMQTEQIQDENDVFETEPEESRNKDAPIVMHCQIEQQNREIFRPDNGFLDSFYSKQIKGDNFNCFKEPTFLRKEQIFDPMEMGALDIMGNEKYENVRNKENMAMKSGAGKIKWSRCNSAPPGTMELGAMKRGGFPRYNTTLVDPNDSSLDKWDMMKIILEETEAVFRPKEDLVNLNFISPRPVPFNKKNVRRPFDYDESFSTGSSTSTSSADEVRDMETGDLEDEMSGSSSLTPGSLGSLQDHPGDPLNKSFVTSHDDLYGRAPIPSPSDPNEVDPSYSSISMSSLNDSLSRLESLADRGGSGEKRKQSEVATSTKDENQGSKVRLESPELDEDGPPRARRVLRPEKSGNKKT